MHRVLHVPVLLWWRLIRDVRVRGAGGRESGAFILGKHSASADRATCYALYDDLDPQALETGIVVMRSVGFCALWKLCRELQLDVVADVHTHSNQWPCQSEADRMNPMISEPGHLALILPRYAQQAFWNLRGIAAYEYAGDYRWTDYRQHRAERFRLCVF